MPNDLVTVVIPAFNAEQTIARTIATVCGQTHRALEIIVIDDGSTDATASLLAAIAPTDPRIRIIRQHNAGVAAARNTGWRAGTGGLVAFVDADDLWADGKIERQLAALAADPSVGLVYSGYQIIDADDRTVGMPSIATFTGDVLQALFLQNFIGNGSSVLVPRRVLEEIGGFDLGLHAFGAQGCEDWKFSCLVAERYPFAAVAHADVGYRIVTESMSGDPVRNFRSWRIVRDELARRHPAGRRALATGMRSFVNRMIELGLPRGQLRPLAILLALLLCSDPGVFARVLADQLRLVASPRRGNAGVSSSPGLPFRCPQPTRDVAR